MKNKIIQELKKQEQTYERLKKEFYQIWINSPNKEESAHTLYQAYHERQMAIQKAIRIIEETYQKQKGEEK